MITYELALALKGAGFPQKGNGYYLPLISDCESLLMNPTPEKDIAYIPTLSELIEICGEFLQLSKIVLGSKKWIAYGKCNCKKSGSYIIGGDIPEEAIAKLWLKLKENELPKHTQKT